MRFRFFWLTAGLLGCSGGARQIEIGPPPAKLTRGTFSGPLCAGTSCKCRDLNAPGDGGAGVPTDSSKRYEIRLQSPNQLWANVAGNEMYKSAEQAEACFYVDLPVGETSLELRASEPNGVAAGWSIRELGTQTKSFYDTFLFDCGNPGVCSFEELDGKKAEMKDPKHDHCGSTIVKGVTWDTGKSPDQLHPSELLVRATLKVYKFVPNRPHGDDCSKKQAEERTEDNPIH
ncbi:MAG TPA: hypothetical protein VLB44_19830 [Kofleriaceae bacterium]|nr:hypothetical protein [Kofleriaceae bacterium]